MTLEQSIVAALAENPADYRTNTPLDVLAAHMVASLRQFEASLIARSSHPFFAPGRQPATCPTCEDE